MEEVIRLFKLIQETSSLNEKKKIIRNNSENELFKQCLNFLLDGNVVTGISTKKLNKPVRVSTKYLTPTSSFEKVINYLLSNNTGRDEDITEVQAFLSGHEEDREFYEEMITKTFRLGANAKLVNECIPGLISVFDVMLGTSIEKVKLKGNETVFVSRKLNGCFDGDTYITMADSSKKKIKNIAVGDEVLSFNETTKEISSQKVLNVFDNGLKNKDEWIRIETGIERGNEKNFIIATKNHKIFTPNGWKNAGKLNVGDSIYLREYELSETQKSVLLGIGLGDGSVIFDNDNIKTVRFSYTKKTDGYNDYFHNTCDLFDIYRGTYTRRTSGYGSKMELCSIKTIYNIPSYFTNHDNVLRVGYTFTDEILKNLTPLALAIYYIDDGSKMPCKDDGNKYAVNRRPWVTLATHRHNKAEVERFSRYLYERYLITNKIAKYKPCYDDAGYQIALDMEGTYRFFDLIAKYIPYDLRDQKLSKYWHNVPYEDWTKDFGEYKLVEKKVERIISGPELKIGHNSKRKMNRAYDIEIENNHTYFANNFAVHNCRCVYIGDKLMSRQGKEFKGLEHIINDLKRLAPDGAFVDGELLYKNKEGLSDSASFQKGTGIAMSKDIDKTCLKYVIFDMLPLAEFWRGKSNSRYSIRKESLIKLGKRIEEDGTDNLEIVPFLYEGTDHAKIWECLDYAEEHDWEGVMLNLDTPYECKRTKNLIKVKEFFTADLLCVGIEEGSGRNKGTLGAIVCDYKGNTLNVGSGFSDQQRKYYWQHSDEIIGKIVTVKYKEETKNKDGGISIQFPTFEAIRYDKNEPNYDI